MASSPSTSSLWCNNSSNSSSRTCRLVVDASVSYARSRRRRRRFLVLLLSSGVVVGAISRLSLYLQQGKGVVAVDRQSPNDSISQPSTTTTVRIRAEPHNETISSSHRNDGTTTDLHWCTKPTITIPRPPLDPHSAAQVVVPVYYQCQGPLYENFTHYLRRYVDQRMELPETPGTWGQRPWPIPAHKKVLLFGNSHTRQVTEALVCMYQDDSVLERIERKYPSYFIYHLRNNSTLVAVINSPIPYTKAWVEMLYNETGIPLESYDAIVLGLVNTCGTTSMFSKQMQAVSEQIPGVDCLRNKPPTTTNWTDHFDGPIIFMSMMSHVIVRTMRPIKNEIAALQKAGLDRVSYLDARYHVLEFGTECASFNRTGTSDCLNRIGPTHRCEGATGGHPDLVAWDLIERLYGIFSSS